MPGGAFALIVELSFLFTAVSIYVDAYRNCNTSVCVNKMDLAITENGRKHHTEWYYLMTKQKKELVVRRSQSFKLRFEMNKLYRPKEDQLGIVFRFAGAYATQKKDGTFIRLHLDVGKTSETQGWTARSSINKRGQLVIKLMAGPNALVGNYLMTMEILEDGLRDVLLRPNEMFYILFNPWDNRDMVFLEDPSERQEYVLEENGILWNVDLSAKKWNYGQFSKNVLNCALYLLSFCAKLELNYRGDPVLVARSLSQAVNANQDWGLLVGDWKDSPNGKHPSHWSNSYEIVEKFYQKMESVRYGQCWVFAALLTTMCRTLGIPSRPVSTTVSAHDSDGSISIDYYTNEFYDEVGGFKDSIWTFHVWNEAWMTRPDLGSEYDGWQVIDSTPQEDSDGLKRCGPASVLAVKRGEYHQPYDVPFVYAEVNGDHAIWLKHSKYEKQQNTPHNMSRVDLTYMGKSVMTKAVGLMEGVNIVDHYKYPEKTRDERRIMTKMLNESANHFARDYLNSHYSDVRLHLKVNRNMKYGKPLLVTVLAINFNKFKSYRIIVHIMLVTTDSHGHEKHVVDKKREVVNAAAGTKTKVVLKVTPEVYDKFLGTEDVIHFLASCVVRVEDFQQDFYSQTVFDLNT